MSSGRTVQGTLEAAWLELTGETAKTVVAGRTDAGVHALGQVVSFQTGTTLPAANVAFAMNRLLPADVMVRRARQCSNTFHARFTAGARTYHYFVRRAGRPSVFWDRYSLLETRPLDMAAMEAAGQTLLGTHDFQSFGSAPAGRPTVRRLEWVRFRPYGTGWLVIGIRANAFLKGMARSLVAQFLAAGRNEIDADEVRRRLLAFDRQAAGKSAPPNGLFLARVSYNRDNRTEEKNHDDLCYKS